RRARGSLPSVALYAVQNCGRMAGEGLGELHLSEGGADWRPPADKQRPSHGLAVAHRRAQCALAPLEDVELWRCLGVFIEMFQHDGAGLANRARHGAAPLAASLDRPLRRQVAPAPRPGASPLAVAFDQGDPGIVGPEQPSGLFADEPQHAVAPALAGPDAN